MSRRTTPLPSADAVVLGDLNLVRAVGLAGLRALVVSKNAATARSRYTSGVARIPLATTHPTQAVEALCDLGRSLSHPATLYYSNDAQLLMVSRHRDALARHYRFRLPAPELVESLVDKQRFQDLATRLGLPVPQCIDPTAGRVPFPVVIKPISRVGWFDSAVISNLHGVPHKVLRVDTQQAFDKWTEEMRRQERAYIVQEYIDGDDTEIYSFHAYLDGAGKRLGGFIGRKIRTFPLETGRSTYLELSDRPDLMRIGQDVVDRLGLTGVVKLDFKWDAPRGRFFLLEVNPRFNLWHYLAAVNGMNLPALAHADLQGQVVVPADSYRVAVRWLSVRADLRAVRDGLRAGRWTLTDVLRSYSHAKVYNTFAWRDPLPALFVGGAAAASSFRKIGHLRQSRAANKLGSSVAKDGARPDVTSPGRFADQRSRRTP